MARKPATKAETPAVELKEAVTGTFTLFSVEADDAGNPIDSKALTIIKGKVGEKNVLNYMAVHEGVTGKPARTIKAAINALLIEGLKVLPAAWNVPENEKDVRFPAKGDNKPKEPETLEELPEEVQADLKQSHGLLVADYAVYAEGETRSREATRGLAKTLRGLRTKYNKTTWGIFVKLSVPGSALAELLTSKNDLSEFATYGAVPDDLAALIPAGKKGPKAVLAWLGGMRNELAAAIITRVKKDGGDTGLSDAVKGIIAEHMEGTDKLAFDGGEAAEKLLALHWAGLEGPDRLFDLANDKLVPFKVDGANVTKTVFGTEGADELVSAMCRAYNGYVTADEVAVKADMKGKVSGLVAKANTFLTMTADEVARHLFNILSGRLDATNEETLDKTTEDALIVVDKMAGWLDAVRAGTLTVADILNPVADAPESAEDAEGQADAEA
jgi:hypothetical protein